MSNCTPGAPITPGDDFENRTDWADILETHGWTLESTRGRARYWTRPDKSRREGASATTGRDPGRDRLYVFSTSTVFEAERSYTKFGAFALLNFGGDHATAARELVRLGYGVRRDPAEGIIPPDEPRALPGPPAPKAYSLDEVGNANRLWDRVKGRYHYIAEEKRSLRLVIELRTGDEWKPIGNIGFNNIDWRCRSAEVGIFIGEKGLWNKGYGSEAMRTMLKNGFENLNLNRIFLRVHADNPRAVRSYEKAGFIHEGTFRQAEFKDGQYIDLLFMSVLKNEWSAG